MTIISRYLSIQICMGLLVATAVLLPLFSFLDLQEQLDDVGQGIYQTRDAFFYTLMLLPRRFIQLVPFIALLGNVAALGRLATNLELISLRAAGLSPAQISLVPLSVGLVLLVAVMGLEQFVAPQLQQQAIASRNAALGMSTELGENLGVWTRNKEQILRIGEMQHATRAMDVEILQFDSDGLLQKFIYAAYADIVSDDIWVLTDVLVKTISPGQISSERFQSLNWEPFLEPAEIPTLTKPPESLSPTELFRHVQFLRNTGQETKGYALALWRKAGGLFTTIAMVLISIPFVFGSVRSGLGNKLVFAALTGIGVYLLDQIVANAGLLLNINPALTAILPGLALIGLANLWIRRLV
ncbi:MAG: LPS export ABC transporter permease LptG [Pseudomonadales bacterium]|nr:LPS export ABC transporter permease LptG [Pseudomonadales bacterium]